MEPGLAINGFMSTVGQLLFISSLVGLDVKRTEFYRNTQYETLH
jgi:hypothetical protein